MPEERIDRSKQITFSFDGKDVTAFEGDTIASALIASGQRVFSRSFKYHRPRGEFCCSGRCAHSMVDVDGWPGVRACSEIARQGQVVKHLNAWPTLGFDVMRSVDLFASHLTPPGFYYKTFIRPRRLWPVYEKFLRKAAGLGRLKKTQREREWRTDYRRRHCDVLVIGGGIAGLKASIAASSEGADTVLVDDDIEPGGRLLAEGSREMARGLAETAESNGVEILSGASALGYFDGLVPVWQGSMLHQIRAKAHVAAAGTIEQPLIFTNNDLPGVMSTRGARRLRVLYGVPAGKRVFASVTTSAGFDDAVALSRAGVNVVAIADRRSAEERASRNQTAPPGVEVISEAALVRAGGRNRVRSAQTSKLGQDGNPLSGTERFERCDAIIVDGGEAPASSLLLQAGAKAKYDPRSNRFQAEGLPDAVFAAGSVAGISDLEAASASGALAGFRAAGECDVSSSTLTAQIQQAKTGLEAAERIEEPVSVAPVHAGRGKAFVDMDEDVTVKDIGYAAAEGYDSIELSKRYTTATMGPSQGRFSQLPAVAALAEATGAEVGEIGLTTARPPWTTVPLGVLAGRPHEPAKRSALHGRHRALGASIQWAGDWRRAYDYGDPEAEALAVQNGAGLIDVSTLGKLIVRGPDAGDFLDRIYPNRMSNLKPERIRYGVLTSEAGRISDDGTICRLDDETFYVTTTSSGAGAVEQWFSWWLAEWQLDVYLTDVTQGLSAVNLAGPHSREILSHLTEADCSAEGLGYLDGKQIEVASVPCLALRIGFVGELGYELHCPTPYAEHLWDALMAEGEKFDLRPFGLEPQRILRLQKLHVLVGQDTDSESMPAAAGMPWIVKLDKEGDFIGRQALEIAAAGEAETVLVGINVSGLEVPVEGAVVLENGKAVGQVTSSRFSPGLERVIGMAWVPAAFAEEGAEIQISSEGNKMAATVTKSPFYDPEGELLRS